LIHIAKFLGIPVKPIAKDKINAPTTSKDVISVAVAIPV
jgi:hypothetical protein|tara:strand:- start:162 stop:278 length:117 start_codon:yes stop_codon:yes gene_type:complete